MPVKTLGTIKYTIRKANPFLKSEKNFVVESGDGVWGKLQKSFSNLKSAENFCKNHASKGNLEYEIVKQNL